MPISLASSESAQEHLFEVEHLRMVTPHLHAILSGQLEYLLTVIASPDQKSDLIAGFVLSFDYSARPLQSLRIS
jgi:hypothetical protein